MEVEIKLALSVVYHSVGGLPDSCLFSALGELPCGHPAVH